MLTVLGGVIGLCVGFLLAAWVCELRPDIVDEYGKYALLVILLWLAAFVAAGVWVAGRI